MSDRIAELVLSDLSQQFNGNDFMGLCGPGVYIVMEGEKPLYVGSGKNVLARLSATGHHRHYLLEEASAILFYICRNYNDALELEAILISKLRPFFNKQRSRRVKEIAQRMGWSLQHASLRLRLT